MHTQFGELFAMKAVTFTTQLARVVLTLFILWFLPCLACNNTATSRSVMLSIFHPRLSTLTCSVHAQFGAPTQESDARLMSIDGKTEKSFVSFKAAHPEWIPTDPTGSLYLSHIADLSARRTAGRPHTPLPGHNRRGPHHRPRMGLRTRAAFIADCGCTAARRAHRREPRIWGDVDDARTVDGNGVPVWDGAGRRVERLRWPPSRFPPRSLPPPHLHWR